MSFPQRVQAALAETDCSGLPGVLSLEGECEGAKFHSPTPLILHEVALAPSGAGTTALLCATCCDNLRVLQHLLTTNAGDVPWVVRREFGNMIRALALRGWQMDQADEDEVASV